MQTQSRSLSQGSLAGTKKGKKLCASLIPLPSQYLNVNATLRLHKWGRHEKKNTRLYQAVLTLKKKICHFSRFCVGDKFYLCENKILCEYDYEERCVFASMALNPPATATLAHLKRQVTHVHPQVSAKKKKKQGNYFQKMKKLTSL